VIDGVLAFPALVFTLTFLTVFRDGFDFGWIDLPAVWHGVPLAVAVSIVIIGAPINTRIIRASTLSIVNMEYVQAAIITGCSDWRIIWRHLIPNVIPVVIVVASSQLGTVILLESAVSFLGLGLPPPHASWGGMLQASGRQFFDIQPGLAIFPGSAIIVTVMAINLLGDALRDMLDPRLRGS
jgi:peptide/nickel transport system permease protein